MATIENDKNCAICYEENEDLRMLPCWHVACMSCILGTTQSGQGRAVKCHLCREPFLFENVRSLPKPIKCRSCQKFVSHPKKFPCCPAVYCTDCIGNLPDNGAGEVVCPDLCIGDGLSRNALLQAKLCPLCFCMHSMNGLHCGHSICLGCAKVLLANQRNCPLCLAMNTPMPVPVNPILASGGRAGVQDVNNLPALENGQQISQMQLLSAIQILRSWQQRNPQAVQAQPVQQPQQRDTPAQALMKRNAEISQKYIEVDLPKIGIAVAVFFIVAIIWGFKFWIWAVLTATLSILRPITLHNTFVWGIISLFMLVYTFWNYFFQSIAYIVLDHYYNKFNNVWLRMYFPTDPFARQIITSLGVAVKVIPVFYCFSRPFVHVVLVNLGMVISSQFARIPTNKQE